ncbi:hypothetical protein ABIE66_005383 [Peribacillus sp. B2I2]|uniref:hypothetical protein n=1 Tax=Peribacillus sp. B2I2 TaxID=3156468 RepID=UPI003515CD43
MNFLDKQSLPILVMCLLVPLAVPHPIAGYMATALMLFFIGINKKNLLLILFIYFPARPLLMELNSGLTYTGDLIILTLFVSLLIERFKKNEWHFSNYHFTLPFWLFCLVGAVAALINGVGILPIVFELRALLVTFLLLYIIGELNLERKDIFRFLKGNPNIYNPSLPAWYIGENLFAYDPASPRMGNVESFSNKPDEDLWCTCQP